MPHQPVVAAFDFDGTLTYRDTLLPFLCFSSSFPLFHFACAVPSLVMHMHSRQKCKEDLIFQFFGGVPIEKLREQGRSFASQKLPTLLNPQACARLRWHQAQQHRCVLISANLDVYLEPWGQAMGFTDILTSQVAIDAAGHVTGKLQGENCRGKEKVRRLEAELGPKSGYELYAYGDSSGDSELLALADHGFYRSFGGN